MPTIRPLSELVNLESPAWPELQETIRAGDVDVKVVPVTKEHGEETLLNLQVTSRSPMGSIALNTGGLIVDNGWLRILGGGTNYIASLATVNGLDVKDPLYGTPEKNAGYLIVAYDVAGGIFAIDGGAFGAPGKIFYAGQDTGHEWTMPGFESYSHFIYWCVSEKEMIHQFYQHMRWNGWEKESPSVHPQQAYTFFPFLSTVEGQDIEKVTRSVVPLAEIVGASFKPAWS